MGDRGPGARRRRLLAATTGACLSLVGPALAAPGEQAPVPQLSAAVSPTELPLGAAASVTGTWTPAGRPLAGATLQMQVRPYPYRPPATTASSSPTAPDGSFSFPDLHPDRNTRVDVLVPSAGPGEATIVHLQIWVDPRAGLSARSLGPGRTELVLRIRHAIVPHAVDGSVRWFLAAAGSRVFHLVAQTPAGELRPGLLSASTVVDPPSRRFSFRACVNPSWERAMGPPSSHRPCPTAGFVLPQRHAA